MDVGGCGWVWGSMSVCGLDWSRIVWWVVLGWVFRMIFGGVKLK